MVCFEVTRKASQQRSSLDAFHKYAEWSDDKALLMQPEGREAFRLLSHLSATLAEALPEVLIADVGCHNGFSTLALASGGSNVRVKAYDPKDVMPAPPALTAKTVPCVEFKVTSSGEDMEGIVKSHLIHLKIDPHDGTQEANFVAALQLIGYQGVVVCDDIHVNPGMQRFWSHVAQQKYDATIVGHWSGTGIIVFDPSVHQVRGSDVMLTV